MGTRRTRRQTPTTTIITITPNATKSIIPINTMENEIFTILSPENQNILAAISIPLTPPAETPYIITIDKTKETLEGQHTILTNFTVNTNLIINSVTVIIKGTTKPVIES
jgi:hypothetical protein